MMTRRLHVLSTLARLGMALALGLGLMILTVVLLTSTRQAAASAQAAPAVEAPAATVGGLFITGNGNPALALVGEPVLQSTSPARSAPVEGAQTPKVSETFRVS